MRWKALAATLVVLATTSLGPGEAVVDAQAAPNPDGLWMAGEAGDYIIGEQHLAFGAPTLQAGGANFVQISLEEDGRWFWVQLAVPTGGRLAVGSYENARRYPFNGSDPGLAVWGDGRGCNTLTGRFDIDQIEFDADDRPIAVVARWEQHCEGREPASFGAVSIGGTVPWPNRSIAPASVDLGSVAVGSATPYSDVVITNDGPSPLNVAGIELTGRDASSFRVGAHACVGVIGSGSSCAVPVRGVPGSVGALGAALTVRDDVSGIGGGDGFDVALTANGLGIASAFVQGESGDFVIRSEHLSFDDATVGRTGGVIRIDLLDDGRRRTVYLEVPDGAPLAAGVYDGATRYPFNATTEPGLSVSGNGRGCNRVAGRFVIDDIAIGTNGDLARLAARWEQHCEGGVSKSHGAIDFNSDAPYRDRTTSPWELSWSDSDRTIRTVTVDNAGPDPLPVHAAVIGGPDAARFEVVANRCAGRTIAAGSACTIDVRYRPTVVMNPVTHTAELRVYDDVTPDHGARAGQRIPLSGTSSPGTPGPGPDPDPPTPTNAGEFTALAPVRVLDTRTGNGAGRGPLRADGTVHVTLAGRGGVPSTGVAAVVLNATAVGATRPTFVSIWPTGQARPFVSNLNPSPGAIATNMVTVGLGSGGRVSAYNLAGELDLIFDVVGYYTTADGPAGSRFVGVTPTRLLDTRTSTAARPAGAVGPRKSEVLDLDPWFVGGTDGAGVTAIVANVTVTEPTAPSFVTVHPNGGATPLASHLNFLPGQTVPNLVTVKVPESGLVDFYNLAGNSHLIVDLVGFYTDEFSGDWGRFVATTPTRAWDTRLDVPLGAGDVLSLAIVELPEVAPDATSIAMNVTVTQPTAAGFVTVFPDDACELPLASNLNFLSGQTTANSVISRVAAGVGCGNGPGWVATFNPLGRTHLIVDVFGYFT